MGFGNYCAELAKTPQKVRRRAFMTKSLAQMEESAAHQSVHELKRVLGPLLLTVICLGQIIGSGIFVLTGAPPRPLPACCRAGRLQARGHRRPLQPGPA
jgi:hypothetical protein